MPRLFRLLTAVVLTVSVLFSGGAPAGAAPSDPFWPSLWNIRQIKADAAWTVTRGAGVRIGIVDTGIDLGHPEFAGGKVVAAANCIGARGNPNACNTNRDSAQDDNGHGTHVAGIAAAPINGVGVVGVAPEAGLVIVKALSADGSGVDSDVAAGILWAASHGANVINLSLADSPTLLGLLFGGSPIKNAISQVFSQGVVVVLAAGNDGASSPGALQALVVAATGRTDLLASYSLSPGSSQWGLAAPGGDGAPSQDPGANQQIVSTYLRSPSVPSGYGFLEGTSMAAPHVAGVAALVEATGLRGQAVVTRILGTSDPVSCGNGCHGRVDAARAVGATGLSPSSPTPTSSAPAATSAATKAPRTSTAPVPSSTATTPTTAPAAPSTTAVPATPAVAARSQQSAGSVRLTPKPASDSKGRPTAMAAVALVLLLGVVAGTAKAARGRGGPAGPA